MIVTGWSNGSPNNHSGAGYGIRITRKDRDMYFRKGWDSVIIELDNGDIKTVGLSSSFWKSCVELRSTIMGKWMLNQNLAPWEKGSPPRLRLVSIGNTKFKLGK